MLSGSGSKRYIGRFAPSPTGPLHLGSLYTALASYLDARSHRGLWLLRIDDLDTPRNVPGAAEQIINELQIFGLHWDGPIDYQSEKLADYHHAIDRLLEEQRLYRCSCSRKSLAEATHNQHPIYPGFCRVTPPDANQPAALRIKTDDLMLFFQDRLQGFIQQNLSRELGDFIVQRKDRIVAYQLAVVIDDHQQNITDVVRGYDLLDSTPRQIFIQRLLGYQRLSYMHVPIIVDEQGHKLSKQTHAQAVDTQRPAHTLFLLLKLLKQKPPASLGKANVTEILDWAIAHWQPENLKKVRAIH
ncbi:tRNA glutamyl-Q(34) synthetase GluQRS [Methylomarinum sp. Ch1-1]|uniref:Glutamyl-Q tRNA(Asp) synthetase n=1 Tax=Methylomarinum roseum TaxID=3067653 RepID=A0AAU7P060_9GAMM